MITPILRARQQVAVKRHDLAQAVGRSCYWLERVELGKQPITPEEEIVVLKAIRCLAAFARAMAIKRQEFLGTLRLPPPARTGTSRPSLPGN